MNNQSPTAQSGLSATTDAEVRAWVERHDFGSMSLTDARCAIEDAQSIDRAPEATTPPARARDASDFEYRTLSLPGANGDRAWLPWQQFGTHMQIRERALAGKADGGDAKCPACAGQGWDYNYTPRDKPSTIKCPQCKGTGKATQPAAPGAVEYDRELIAKMLIDPPGTYTEDAIAKQVHLLLFADHADAASVHTATNTAATGMGDAEIRRVIHELRTYNPIADEYKGAHIHSVWARELEAALAAQPAPVVGGVDGVARLLADAAGHGMREKCEPLARQIVELLAARPGGDAHAVAFVGTDGGLAWIHDGNGLGVPTIQPVGTLLFAHPAQAGGGRS